ncbi:hypothetical protein ACE38W_15185 [Chitinophaga sp. Hz27]|uniref:hypothetical protein n=1 Tax=Chitinophaga sp. Hz27 TaxID=3347169 RepID=UPI0035D61855
MIKDILQQKTFLVIAAILLLLLLLSNYNGYRICNCATTDKYTPGEARSGGRTTGVHHFYHK